MIYTVTLTNKETEQEVSRNYDLDRNGDIVEIFKEGILNDMLETLDDDQEKF